jgi:hypothetical protein
MWTQTDTHFTSATISQAGNDVYSLSYSPHAHSVQVSAPAEANTNSNNRGVFWPKNELALRDGESCARWSAEDGGHRVIPNIQEGLALRVRNNDDGSLDAITITRNVWGEVPWIFNVNLWHVGDPHKPGLQNLVGANLQQVFGPEPSLPWRICAKVAAKQLSFVVWLDGRESRPHYGDKTHGLVVTLPPNYVYAGTYGWYAGHLTRGQSVTYDGLTVNGLPADLAGGFVAVPRFDNDRWCARDISVPPS